MADIGHPVVGDKLYGIEGMILKRQGLFLCAVELRFTHPVNGDMIRVQIDEPPKFQRFMDRETDRMTS
jgi:23S rRNA-/tRNA-specific pseudouridylate synthase